MAFNEQLADRVRHELAHMPDVREIKMYGGLAFMVNNKMCVCIGGDDGNIVMLRVGKEAYDDALKQKGVMPAIMKNKPVMGYVEIGSEGQKNLTTWVEMALKFNNELTKPGK